MRRIVGRARFKRDHHWAPGRMSDYVDGELAPRGRARMERHTKECSECRGALRGLRRLLGRLQRLPRPSEQPSADDIVDAVRRRLHTPPGD